jgi:hypothetical protein
MSICWSDAILVPASAFPASAVAPDAIRAGVPGAPQGQDEIHAAERASIRFAEQALHATPHEVPAQDAIRLAEQALHATPREVPAQAAIRHGFRVRDEIQREAQWLRATLSAVFP